MSKLVCHRCGQPIKAKRPTAKRGNSFSSYDDFVPAFNAARRAIAAAYGERWYLVRDAYTWARVPAAWVRCPVYGRVSTAPRDVRIPAGEFWPAGMMPIGPEYAEPIAAALIAEAA